MKIFKNVLPLMLIFTMIISVFAACGGGIVNSFAVEDIIDSSETQQRWLRHPQNKLVLNPDEYTGQNTLDSKKLPLSFGIVDENGAVTKSANDALFFLESKSANGKGGSELFSADFGGGSNVSDFSTLKTNNSEGTHFNGTTSETPVSLKVSDTVLIDYTIEYQVIVEVESCAGTMVVGYNAQNPTVGGAIININKPGTYTVNLTDHIKSISIDKSVARTTSINLLLSANGSYNVSYFGLKEFKPGYQYASESQASVWSPYGINSTLEYTNGTKLEVYDMLMGTNSISRTITCINEGTVSIGGKIYGTPEYNSKTNLFTFEADGFKYLLNLKKKGTVAFYNNETDMLANANSTETPSADSQYWVLTIPNLKEGDSYSVGIAADTSLGFDELKDAANDAGSGTRIKKAQTEAVEFWNDFIANNDVSGFISNTPKG